jgi:hypothetical protein
LNSIIVRSVAHDVKVFLLSVVIVFVRWVEFLHDHWNSVMLQRSLNTRRGGAKAGEYSHLAD